MTRNKTEFKVLKAFNGDCILVQTFDNNQNEFIILVDGGTSSTFDYSLKKELKNLSKIDLLVLTHVDSDHIGGLIKFFKNSLSDSIEISNIWVNSPELINIESGSNISFAQGDNLEKLINEKVLNSNTRNDITSELTPFNFNNIQIEIISPTNFILSQLYEKWKKDSDSLDKIHQDVDSKISNVINHSSYESSLIDLNKEEFKPNKSIQEDIVNSSSISFILTCPDLKLLFLADSRPEIIIDKLTKAGYSKSKKLKVDYVKVSHHGSKNNTSKGLLDLISCDNYIISTNGGNGNHKHPSRETIAKLIYNEERNFSIRRNIYLNYSLKSIKDRIGDFVNEKDLHHGNWKITSQNHY